MCRPPLQVNVSALWACTVFRWWWKSGSSLLEDERDVCVSGWIHSSQFRCLLHTALLSPASLPPFCPYPLLFRPSLGCQIPISAAQQSHRRPETSTNRITMMLKGLWWANWDKSVEFRRGCSLVPPCTNWFPCRNSHCQHAGTSQMNEFQKAFSRSRTCINRRSDLLLLRSALCYFMLYLSYCLSDWLSMCADFCSLLWWKAVTQRLWRFSVIQVI